jgi:2-polyprenyl-3-methyl-5-hydroxy-6-metoxy-1,4-benzoquinol methylase
MKQPYMSYELWVIKKQHLCSISLELRNAIIASLITFDCWYKMNEFKIKTQYDRLANIYDLRWRNYITNTLTFLYNWEPIDPEATILDVACGTGEFERLLLNQNPTQKITGIDISEKMLNVAQEKYQTYPNVNYPTPI